MVSKASIFVKVFLSLLIAVVLAGVIGFIMYFTNNLTTDLSTFYVQYGSTEYRRDTDGLTLQKDIYNSFECKYPLGFPSSENGAHYSVKILPNQTSDNIEYIVDGSRASYYPNDKLDLSKAFEIKQYTDSFTVNIPADLTFITVLETAYEGKQVTDIPQIELTAKEYFSLVVTSYDGKTVIKINFRLMGNEL